jgi:hypothetical protein
VKYATNLNTFADLVDRLAIEINKVSVYENLKREEHAKDTPNWKAIVDWDIASRDANENRSYLKNAINYMLTEIVSTGNYETLTEARTFRASDRSIEDLLDDISLSAAEHVRMALSEKLKEKLKC